MFAIKGHAVTPSGVLAGAVLIEHGQIVDVTSELPENIETHDFGAAWVVPGFIDLHLHGLGKFEALDTESLVGMAQLEPQYGTTGFLPTGAAMTTEQYVELGKNARQAIELLAGAGARILGVHLEGPFINPHSSGAMARSTRRPITEAEARIYVEQIGDMLKLVTFSPELDGGIDLIKYLHANGIVPALGHSMAEGEQLPAFVAAGLRHVTHMFNAFVASGEKEAGVLKAGLIEHVLVDETLICEFICDMQHVAPELIRLASKMLGPDRFVAITDSLRGAGLADGLYLLPNGAPYRIADGVARLHEGKFAGCLAGSVLTMNRAFGNLVEKCGLDPVLASKYTATNAARVLGIDKESGSIAVGKRADLAVLDADYQCLATLVNGKFVYQKM